jgi:ribose transport system substrate-binding protein
VPEHDYDPNDQSHHLRRLLERRRDYMGGIVIATEAQRQRGDLGAFCRKVRLPVVFTDIEPFAEESAYPENAAFVGYDTGALGELAGRWLVRRLRGNAHPRVLVIASREHRARQQRCAEALRLGLPDVSITVDDSAGFVRSRAVRAVRAYLRDLDPGQRLDAIFCTNDEMALGAVDALAAGSPATASTVVVGIDGVREAKVLIDTVDSPLRATVEQDDHKMAACVVDVLEKMRRGEQVASRHFLEAEVYEGR